MMPSEKNWDGGDLYRRIVADVAAGRIRPGERLGENSLAARLGESRGAVREAMTRLEQGGVVVREDNVGSFIRRIEDDELLEIYDVRIALEPLVAIRLAQVASGADLEALDRLARQIDRPTPPSADRDVLDNVFHQTMIDRSGLKHIARLMRIGNLHVRCSALHQKIILSRAQAGGPIARPDHRTIVKALRTRDPDKAGSTVAEHLRAARKNTVAEIERIKTFMAVLENS